MFLSSITAFVFVLLVVIAGIHPAPILVSQFELRRRSKSKSKVAIAQHRRELLLPDIYGVIAAKTALLLVTFVLMSVVTFGWLIGVLIAVVGVLVYPVIAKWGPSARLSDVLYRKYENTYLDIVEKFQPVFKVIRSVYVPHTEPYHRFDSREELQRLIDQAGNILSKDERKLIIHSLAFKDQRVDSIMTPRSLINSIKKTEFLGPLVLSEIHETGNSRLPVVGADIDHIVGVLHLRDLLSLDIKRSVTAEKAMEPKVYYVRYDQTLEHALAAFLDTRHHLFIVINEQRETVGLLTLEDVMEALLGRRIVDEDDNHEDLRSIAAKRTVDNNSPDEHIDV